MSFKRKIASIAKVETQLRRAEGYLYGDQRAVDTNPFTRFFRNLKRWIFNEDRVVKERSAQSLNKRGLLNAMAIADVDRDVPMQGQLLAPIQGMKRTMVMQVAEESRPRDKRVPVPFRKKWRHEGHQLIYIPYHKGVTCETATKDGDGIYRQQQSVHGAEFSITKFPGLAWRERTKEPVKPSPDEYEKCLNFANAMLLDYKAFHTIDENTPLDLNAISLSSQIHKKKETTFVFIPRSTINGISLDHIK